MEPDTYFKNNDGRIRGMDITAGLQEVQRLREGTSSGRNKRVVEFLLSRTGPTRHTGVVATTKDKSWTWFEGSHCTSSGSQLNGVILQVDRNDTTEDKWVPRDRHTRGSSNTSGPRSWKQYRKMDHKTNTNRWYQTSMGSHNYSTLSVNLRTEW